MSHSREAYLVKRISFFGQATYLSVTFCERRDTSYEIRDRGQVPC